MAKESALTPMAARPTAAGAVRARVVLVLAAAVIATSALWNIGTAAAHPLGNFTINRYARIEVYGDAFIVHYVVDYAEIPTVQLISQIDADADGRLSSAELSAYAPIAAQSYAANLSLSVAKPLTLRTESAEAHVAEGQAGLDVLRVAVVYRASVPAAGQVAVSFRDENFAAKPGWKEVVVRPSAGAATSVPPAALIERSDALRQYPAESLTSAPSDTQVVFTWSAGTGEAAPSAVVPVGGAVRSAGGNGFASLLDHDRSLGLILLSLLAAFGFGALHALGPGHGKSVVAAYLVGSRGTARHAVALGATVTATHTSTVYLLGFITLTASSLIAPDQLFLYLGVASGVMIVLMGAGLLTGRLRSLGRHQRDETHRHGLFGKAHSHLPVAAHVHAEGHDHPHAESHQDEPGRRETRVGWKGLLTLGVAGGMIPCPSAIVVMLAAISLGQVLFGMLLIVAFSLGLAGVLTGIGIALVWGKRLSGRRGFGLYLQRPAAARIVQALPILSAVGVTLAGVAITYQAWNQPGL